MPSALRAHKSTCQKPKEKVNCQYCNLPFNALSIGAHQTSCRRKHKNDLSDNSDIEAQPDESSGSTSVIVTGSEPAPIEIKNSPPLFTTVGNSEPYEDDELSYEIDDIKTKHHLHSSRPTQIDHFEDYGLSSPKEPLLFHKYGKPWYPFTTRKDFEFAEIILKSQMKEEDVNGLLQIFQDCCSPDVPFTLKSHQNIKEIWKEASHMMTPQSIGQLRTTSNSITKTSGIGCWTLWETPSLLHTLSGMHSGCISLMGNILSDSTMNHEQQTGSGQFNHIFLKMENHFASSFMQIKRNYHHLVQEDESEKGKKAYVDFKTVVWHESFRKLLESIRDHSKLGFWFKCGDDILCRLFPLILILSADYEEQWAYALVQFALFHLTSFLMLPQSILFGQERKIPSESYKQLNSDGFCYRLADPSPFATILEHLCFTCTTASAQQLLILNGLTLTTQVRNNRLLSQQPLPPPTSPSVSILLSSPLSSPPSSFCLSSDSYDEKHAYTQSKSFSKMSTLASVDPTSTKAPILTQGDISPAVMMDFENAALDFFISKSIPANKQVTMIIPGIKDLRIHDWITAEHARIIVLPFVDFMTEMRANYLPLIGKTNWSQKLLKLNCLLRGTPSAFDEAALHNHLEAHLNDKLKVKVRHSDARKDKVFKTWVIAVHLLDEARALETKHQHKSHDCPNGFPAGKNYKTLTAADAMTAKKGKAVAKPTTKPVATTSTSIENINSDDDISVAAAILPNSPGEYNSNSDGGICHVMSSIEDFPVKTRALIDNGAHLVLIRPKLIVPHFLRLVLDFVHC
ncbi:uncharacterized protein LACBIDRAFT_333567 [Laccaria bicolor S238N-H82]|uniref:Predicted protein n=1 Tax=Laccaria bicolor (strain S238N-H82 / ATCC MYA-4686) TaxID=486041 RepID=B0DWC2_LACBS|nr:uncharacterized protein LACBIDRAFT_333567 [Laccaria bicolor S238N-H82]EDR01163.1 predicted protein [Laccaria bicolor S238N-H82]|eukprot:XP_001888205.1 predicted protein [Laccaria bicolor S238N-H82]